MTNSDKMSHLVSNFRTILILFLMNRIYATDPMFLKLSNQYEVAWKVSSNRTNITFEVTVQTTGYIAFGLSTNGGMKNADIVVFTSFSDGTRSLKHYRGPAGGNGNPIEDKNDNYNFISSNENGTHTSVVFSRRTITCDPEDIDITDAGLHIIWSFGDTDELKKHKQDKFGSKSVYLLDLQLPPFDGSLFDHYRMTATIKMPQKTTTYWCTIHKLPKLTTTHHLIALEALLETPEAKKYIHHFTLRGCTKDPSDPKSFEPWVGSEGAECHQFYPAINCFKLEYGWALGGEIFVNPPDVGLPFESENYYMLEIHLHNPDHDQGIITGGMQMFHTNKLRRIEASQLMISAHIDNSLMIPPSSSNFVTAVHFMPKCTSFPGFPSEGVTVYNVFLHAHTSGRKIRLRHFRNDTELPWIMRDDNFDFNYQTNRRLSQPVKILPGDQMTLECEYDTHWIKGKVVFGGQSTEEEMCLAILFYHSKTDYFGSMDEMHFEYFLNTRFNGIMRNDSRLSETIEAFDWTDSERNNYQQLHRYGPHEGFCMKPNEPGGEIFRSYMKGHYPENFKEFVPLDVCYETHEKSLLWLEDSKSAGTNQWATYQPLSLVILIYSLVQFLISGMA